VCARIEAAEARAGRAPGSVRLVAVTKRCPAQWARDLAACGQLDLGENYPQELWAKAADPGLPPQVAWHLIGHLQSNKARRTWPLARMIHAVDSLRLAAMLDRMAEESPPGPELCLQLNLSGEPTKHGWDEAGFWADLDALAALRSARIVGLMTMAAFDTTAEEARPTFARLRAVRDRAEARLGRALPELSMGMSGDFEAAVAEGATLVRVGSALFRGLSTP
jgi:pyridoxal phosphate enzyme (YggS family)